MKCQDIVIILRYLMKRLECLLRFFYRIKTQIVERENGPITSKERKRLGHVAELQEMENSETENKTSDMVTEYLNESHDIEFVEVENDTARVEPATDAQATQEENWDNEVLNHPEYGPPQLNPFPIDAMNTELDYPNVEQLTVQPFHEVSGEPSFSSESLTDPETSANGTLTFTFKIENLSAFCSRPNKVISESFKCRNLPFSLIVHNRSYEISIAAYLVRDKTGDDTMDEGLDILVTSCNLSVVDQLTGSVLSRVFSNQIFHGGADWGFNDFINTSSEWLRDGLMLNNSIIIQVQIKTEPPYCYSHYSKSITGCVGIKNQGATCYMNSLFFLTKFRTACYRIPTECDDNSSMPLALQKVFYNLEFSDAAVCTRNLTKSFGWSNVDVLMQHDIQEMMRVLIEKIEGRMKNTLLEPILPSIFEGKFISYVKCLDIEFSSQREEVFYDIQLSLDNSNNLIESFKRYCSPEVMDNENKYHAGAHGLQAAEKGTSFISLPPVLFLHLLRFQFDGSTSQVMKNNSFFSFDEHIDLTEFVRDDDETTWKYTLFAVLSHSGGGSQGHYVAYINPSLKGSWLKFDDDKISLVNRSDAIDSNFGSNDDVDEWTKSLQLNAYMLVYVRDCDVNSIFEPVDLKYITEELKNSVEKDLDRHNYNCLQKYHYTTDVYVFLSTLLESGFRFKLAKYDRPKIMPKFAVARDLTTNDFKKVLRSAFNITGHNQIRLWPIMHRSPYSHPIYLNENDLFVSALTDSRDRYSGPLSVWVEMALPGEELPSFTPEIDVLVFYYYYCARECRPLYMNHGYHNKNSKENELNPVLNRLMGWSNRELNIYQDLRETKATLLNPSDNLSDYAQHHYNTYLMQVVFESTEHDESTKLNSIDSYYQDLLLRVHITIFNSDNPKVDEHFDVSLQSTFPELLDKLARRLNYDKKKIQIFESQQTRDIRGDPIPSSSTETLHDLLNSGGYRNIQLFYKLHPIDVIDVETKHNFTFQSLSIDLRNPEMHTLYLSDGETVQSILAEARKVIKSDQVHGSGEFRVLYVNENQLSLVKDSKHIYNYIATAKAEGTTFLKRKYYRIEEIPKGDEILDDNERYVVVLQCRYFAVPSKSPIYSFIFKVNMNKQWQCVKDRLRSRLNLSETTWGDYRPSVVLMQNLEELDVDDTKCLNDYEQLISVFSICLNLKYNNYKVSRTCNKFDVRV